MGIYIKQLQDMKNAPPENEAVTFELNAFMRDLEEYLTHKLGKEVTIFLEPSKYDHSLIMWATAPAKGTVVDNQSPILYISRWLKFPLAISNHLRHRTFLQNSPCRDVEDLRKELLNILTPDKISGIINDLGAR